MRRYYASDWEQSSRDGVVAHLTGCGCNTGCGTGCGCNTGCGCDTGCGCNTGCGCDTGCGCNTGCGCDPGCDCPGPVLPPVPPCPGPFPPNPGIGPTGPTGTYKLVQLLPKNNTGGIIPVQADFLNDAAPKVTALLKAPGEI